MYEAFYDGDEIWLWCDGKGREQVSSGLKRKADNDDCEQQSKKEKNEEREREIRDKLENEHGNKYSGPQYTL